MTRQDPDGDPDREYDARRNGDLEPRPDQSASLWRKLALAHAMKRFAERDHDRLFGPGVPEDLDQS